MSEDSNIHGFLSADRARKRRMSTQMAEVGSGWEKITGNMDKQTSMLILNLVILGVVVWLMYTLATSYESIVKNMHEMQERAKKNPDDD